MLVLSQSGFDRSLDLAYERVYLVVVGLLHQAVDVGKDSLDDRSEKALCHAPVHQDLNRVCLHLERHQPRRQKPYEVEILDLPQFLFCRIWLGLRFASGECELFLG